jgi:hypothetical protein
VKKWIGIKPDTIYKNELESLYLGLA